jgi:hypothetical protein
MTSGAIKRNLARQASREALAGVSQWLQPRRAKTFGFVLQPVEAASSGAVS